MLTPTPKIDGLRRRFERKIWKDLATGCWNWTAALDTRGYPRIRYGSEILYAHRAAAILYLGVPEDARVSVRVTCGSRKCVNPEHCRVEEA